MDPFRTDTPRAISALQHFVYCPRQCGLIHLEAVWSESGHTAQGRALHKRVDAPGAQNRHGVRTEFRVVLRSHALGLYGLADAVEVHPHGPIPVEFKRGRPKKHDADLVQLCAQAICLEEMCGHHLMSAFLYYGTTKRRMEVELTDSLRTQTHKTAWQLHKMFASGNLPTAQYEAHKCDACSLAPHCMPKVFGKGVRSAARHMSRARPWPHTEHQGDDP